MLEKRRLEAMEMNIHILNTMIQRGFNLGIIPKEATEWFPDFPAVNWDLKNVKLLGWWLWEDKQFCSCHLYEYEEEPASSATPCCRHAKSAEGEEIVSRIVSLLHTRKEYLRSEKNTIPYLLDKQILTPNMVNQMME